MGWRLFLSPLEKAGAELRSGDTRSSVIVLARATRALHTVLFFRLREGIDGDAITYLICEMMLCLFFVVLVSSGEG